MQAERDEKTRRSRYRKPVDESPPKEVSFDLIFFLRDHFQGNVSFKSSRWKVTLQPPRDGFPRKGMHRATGEKEMTAQLVTILATDGSMPIDYEAEGLLHPDNHVEQTGTWKRADGGTDDPENDYGAIDIHAIRT